MCSTHTHTQAHTIVQTKTKQNKRTHTTTATTKTITILAKRLSSWKMSHRRRRFCVAVKREGVKARANWDMS